MVAKIAVASTDTFNKVTVADGTTISVITAGTQGIAGPNTIGSKSVGFTLAGSDGGDFLIYDNVSDAWLNSGATAAQTLTASVYNLQLNGGGVVANTILDEDNLGTNSNQALATQQSIKAYVDATVTAQDLDFQGDSGGALSIDLDSETLTIAGGTGLSSVGSGNSLTINIDATVATLTGAQNLTNKTLVSPVITTPDINGGDISSTTTINKSPVITLAGDLSGAVTLSNLANGTLTATIVANAVTLGTDTTGNYVATVAAGEGIDVSGSGSETAGVTISAEDATDSNKGIASFNATDFAVSSGAVTLVAERIQDLVGAMVSGNTESGIAVTYQDSDGTIDFDVADPVITLSGDVAGSATMTNLGNVTIATTIQANSIALGTDTTGNYIATVAAGEGIDVSGSGSETATITISAEDATDSNKGVASFNSTDFTVSSGAVTVNAERVQDIVGAMVSSNTESGISVTYEDGDGTLDFNVADPTVALTGDVAGSAVMTNLGNVTIATTIQANSVAMGTDTAGNYVATVAGTSNEIEVSGSGSETAAVTVGLPNDVTIGQDLTVTRDLVVTRNLTVNGTQTTINTANLDVEDTTIRFAKNASSLAATDGAGLEFGGSSSKPTITWDNTNARLSANKRFYSAVGFTGDLVGAVTGNADSATILATARTVHGVSFNGSANIDLSEQIQDTVGAMFTSNTETGLSAAYQDGDGTIDLVVAAGDITNAMLAGSIANDKLAGSIANGKLANSSITVTDGSNSTATALGGTITFSAGEGIDVAESSGTITVSGEDATSSNKGIASYGSDFSVSSGAVALSNSGATAASYGTSTAIPVITVDVKGRITAISTNAISTSFTLAADSGSNDTFNTGETMTFTGGEGMDTTVSNNVITIAGEDATDSNKGLASFNATDFSVSSGAVTLQAERIQDLVGAMVTGNTESGIAVTYQDGDGTLDFDVGDFSITLTGDVTGAGTVTNLGNVSFAATIAANSVALGTDTTGSYVTSLVAGTGVSLSNNSGESATPTIAIGQAVATNSNVTFGSTAITNDLTVDTNVFKVNTTTNRVGILNASPDVSLDIGTATDAVHLPAGTTGQRPGSPAAGYLRYNTSLTRFEGYTDAWGEIGGGGANTFSVNTYTTANASTTQFTLSQIPASEDNLIVFVEGVFQNPGDFTLSGNVITLDAAPPSGRKIVVYSVRAAISGSNLNQDAFSGTGSATAFTLSITPVSENNTQVFIDGVYQNKSTYAVSGTTLTFDTAPGNGTSIEAMTFTQTDINVPVNDTVDTAHIKADAITAAKIADAAISDEHLSPTIISSLTTASAVSADHFMIFDATDSGLKKALVSDVLESSTSINTAADATAIWIDSGENVGIGSTANSSYKLKVAGSQLIDNNLTISGNGSVGGTLGVTGVSTFNGQIRIESSTAQALYLYGAAGVNPYMTINEYGVKAWTIGAGTSGSGAFSIGGDVGSADAILIDSSYNVTIPNGALGVGLAPAYPLHVESSVAGDWMGKIKNTHATNGYGLLIHAGDDASVKALSVGNYAGAGDYLVVRGDGNVGIGTPSPQALIDLTVSQAKTVTSGATFAQLGKTNESSGYASLQCEVKGGASAADRKWLFQTVEQGVANAGSIVFQPDGGNVGIGVTAAPSGSTGGFWFGSDQFYTSTSGTGANYQIRMYNGNGLVGSIVTDGSATAYNTSSDYRLKENVSYTWDATTRLKQLKPARFNFIVDDTTIVDGFLAHEVSSVVPEAITGEKDAEEMQAIDQSKLVPLLVKTIQELEARITALEA